MAHRTLGATERVKATGTAAPAAERLAGAELVRLLSDSTSLAIVGASANLQSSSGRPLAYLQKYGFEGSVTLVNPRREQIAGVPCLPSVADIPSGSAELALVAVGAPEVAHALRQLEEVGTRVAIVLASGFEPGDAREVAVIAASSSMRVIGPNCLGMISQTSRNFMSFSGFVGREEVREGGIALVTQSGGMGNVILISLLSRGAGISHWFTTGDEVQTGALELVSGLLEREEVKGVGVFLEGLGDLDWLPLLAAGIEATDKPVYLFKAAQTDAGAAAAVGHTGRIVGSAEASLEVMRGAGITPVPSMGALNDALVALDLVGRLRGRRVGIVTVSGGSGVIAADAVTNSRSLAVADFDQDPVLNGMIGGRVHEIYNPLDVAGSPTELYADWVKAVAATPSCDVVIGIEARVMHDEEVLAGALEARNPDDATIVLVPISEDDPVDRDVTTRLARAGVVVISTVERAVAALDDLPGAPAARRTVDQQEHEAAGGVLGLEATVEALGPGWPWSRFAVVDDVESARARAREWGFPVVLKAAGRTVQHRSDAGGVYVGVTEANLEERFTAVQAVAARAGDAVMVQEQVPSGVAEVLVSGVRDPEVGPIVYVRPGGVLTELMSGTTVLWHGWSRKQQGQRLLESTVGRVLDGYRGGPVGDMEALLDVIERVLEALDRDAVSSLELNPVMVGEVGVHLVDALAGPSNRPVTGEPI